MIESRMDRRTKAGRATYFSIVAYRIADDNHLEPDSYRGEVKIKPLFEIRRD